MMVVYRDWWILTECEHRSPQLNGSREQSVSNGPILICN